MQLSSRCFTFKLTLISGQTRYCRIFYNYTGRNFKRDTKLLFSPLQPCLKPRWVKIYALKIHLKLTFRPIQYLFLPLLAEGASSFAESSELAAALEAVLDERVLDERALDSIADCVFTHSPHAAKPKVNSVDIEWQQHHNSVPGCLHHLLCTYITYEE